MKALVVYDSTYGNTKKIAKILASEIGDGSKELFVDDFDLKILNHFDLLIVGSPIQGWRPTAKIHDFLEKLKKDDLKDKKVAAFDTRMNVWYSGDAVKKIVKYFLKIKARVVSSEFFIVSDKEGPIKKEELEKVKSWAKDLKEI